MPGFRTSQENAHPTARIVAANTEMMKQLLREGKLGKLVPTTMTLTDAGRAILRPALSLLN
jgi:2-keto-3-deoxy-L-rhamnonate aldolase RhmA